MLVKRLEQLGIPAHVYNFSQSEITPQTRGLRRNFHDEQSKYYEKKAGHYQLFYNEFVKENKTIRYVRIPGPVAHRVFMAFLEQKLSFMLSPFEELYSITRLDFKINHPGFELCHFRADSDLLTRFRNEQNQFAQSNNNRDSFLARPVDASHLELEKERSFGLTYIGKRRSRRMLRIYFSQDSDEKCCEIELKLESARAFSRPLEEGNIWETNKLVVLEFHEMFQHLVECDFTAPLFDWYRTNILTLKETIYSDSSLYKKSPYRIQDGESTSSEVKKVPVVSKRSLQQLYDTDGYVCNTKLLTLFPESTKETARLWIVMMFCIQKLHRVWQNKYTMEEYQARVSREAWHPENIKKQLFLQGDDFSVSFELQELVSSLYMTYNSHSKKVTVDLLHSLFTGKVTFQVDGDEYHQHLINNLQILQMEGRGNRTQVHLTLHPLVFFNLQELYTILPKDVLMYFYEMVTQTYLHFRNIDQLRNRRADVAQILFMRFCFAFLEMKPQLLMEQVKSRNKKKLEYREMTACIFFCGMRVFEDQFGVKVALEKKRQNNTNTNTGTNTDTNTEYNKYQLITNFKLIFDLFTPASDKHLQHLNFCFVEGDNKGRQKLLLDTAQIENSVQYKNVLEVFENTILRDILSVVTPKNNIK